MSFIPAESIEAAKAAREAEAAREAYLARFDDPNYSPKSPYGPYTVAYEEDIALEAIGLDTHGPSEQHENPEQLQERNSEGLYTPFVEGFVQGGFLTSKEGIVVINALSITNDLSVIASLPELSAEQKSELMGALTYIEDPINKEQFIVNFEEDFGAQLGVDDLTDSQRVVFDQIGSNYVLPFDGEIDTATRRRALDTACKASLNQTINSISFERTERYQQLSLTIRNPELGIQEKFKALQEVNILLGSDQGKKGGRRRLDALTAQKRQFLQETGLETQFNEAQQQLHIAQEAKDTKAILVAKARIEELTEHATLGDIGKDWDVTLETGGVEGGKNENPQKAA